MCFIRFIEKLDNSNYEIINPKDCLNNLYENETKCIIECSNFKIDFQNYVVSKRIKYLKIRTGSDITDFDSENIENTKAYIFNIENCKF